MWTGPVGTADVSFDLLGGGRYADLRMDLTPSPVANRVTNKDWVEPFIGISVKAALGEKVGFELRGDAGGFRIGSASDITWNIVTSLEYPIENGLDID